jgi:predicted ATP-grasp superfamily ATP-dependent carboligase
VADGPRVLVTDVEERAVLAVCRGLSSVGYRVSGVGGRKPAAGHWSRSVDRRYSLPNPRLDPAGFVDGLAAIVEQGEHAALVPGVDAAMLAVSENRTRFEQAVAIGLPPHEIVLRCLDKPSVLKAASVAGLAPPASETCTGIDEALEVANRLGYPVVVKPVQSLQRDAHRMMTTQYADDEHALRTLVPEYGAQFTVQRCETGSVVSLSGVVADGALLGLCAARDARMWPPRGGFTSSSETIAPPPGVPERLERFLVELGWQGIFQLELIEGADGALHTIDFNPRPYGSLTLAIEAGANLPALWVDWLLGRAPTPARARPGVRYRWEETEVLNALAAARARRIGDVARILTPRRGTTHAFFRTTDPAPLVARAIAVLRDRV